MSTLAFLSGVSNDSDHITAVCLEELPSQGGCKVLLAINKLKPNCGQDVLEKIQRGFEQIFRRLSNISYTSRREDRNRINESVFKDVVALCRDRILCRLRVKASTAFSYKKEGRFIGDNLEEFLQYPWRPRSARPDMTKDHLRRYRILSQALLEHLSSFNAARDWKHENVVKLVHRVAEFMEQVPLKDVVEILKDHPMDKMAAHRLHSCLSKIARYRQSAFFLSRMAKKLPILRLVTVDHVCLEEAAFQRPSGYSSPRNLNTALKAIPHKRGFLQINNLPCWAQKSQEQFTAKLEKALTQSKIHAEVQIVAHYEAANPEVILPRVIASSKDACYLCHAFIRLHGKYSVPRSHGKLYTGWRLPATQCFEALGCKLDDFLKQEILTNVMRFSRVANKPPVNPPNESTLFPLNISASTLLSCLDLPAQNRRDQTSIQSPSKASELNLVAQPGEDKQYHDPQHPSSSSARRGFTGSINSAISACSEMQFDSEPDGNRAHVRVAENRDDNAKLNSASAALNSAERMASSDSVACSVSRIVTKPQWRAHALPEPIHFSKGRFCHENKEIFIEDSSSSTKLRWLSPADSAKVLGDRAGVVVDVSLLAAGTDTPCLHKGPENVSYFSFGEQVVMIETSNL